jgi:hypothetical protein
VRVGFGSAPGFEAGEEKLDDIWAGGCCLSDYDFLVSLPVHVIASNAGN